MPLELHFTAIRPQLWTLKFVRFELLNMLRKEARFTRKLYQRTTKTWTHKPKFELTGLSLAGDVARITVKTDSKIYSHVDKGTSPHMIVPRRPTSASGRSSALRFQRGYRAKTLPKVIASLPGGKFGAIVYRPGVMHPGIKAREFTKTIASIMRLRFPSAARTAVTRGLAKGIKESRQA